MNLAEQVAARKAEREIPETDAERRKRLVNLTTELISEVVAKANQRSDAMDRPKKPKKDPRRFTVKRCPLSSRIG